MSLQLDCNAATPVEAWRSTSQAANQDSEQGLQLAMSEEQGDALGGNKDDSVGGGEAADEKSSVKADSSVHDSCKRARRILDSDDNDPASEEKLHAASHTQSQGRADSHGHGESRVREAGSDDEHKSSEEETSIPSRKRPGVAMDSSSMQKPRKRVRAVDSDSSEDGAGPTASAAPETSPDAAAQNRKAGSPKLTVSRSATTVSGPRGTASVLAPDEFEVGDWVDGQTKDSDSGQQEWFPGVVTHKEGSGRSAKYTCIHGEVRVCNTRQKMPHAPVHSTALL